MQSAIDKIDAVAVNRKGKMGLTFLFLSIEESEGKKTNRSMCNRIERKKKVNS